MTLVQLTAQKTTFAADCRFRAIRDKMLVTSLDGRFALLTQDEFRAFRSGAVPPESELYQRLSAANLVRAVFDVKHAAALISERKSRSRTSASSSTSSSTRRDATRRSASRSSSRSSRTSAS